MKRWWSILSGTVCLSNSAVCKCEMIQNAQSLPPKPFSEKFHLGAVAWFKTRLEQVAGNTNPSVVYPMLYHGDYRSNVGVGTPPILVRNCFVPYQGGSIRWLNATDNNSR